MALQQWAVPQLTSMLSLDEDSAKQIVSYTEGLSNAEAAEHLQNLLGTTPEAVEFIESFNTMKAIPGTTNTTTASHVVSDKKSKNPFLNLPDDSTQGGVSIHSNRDSKAPLPIPAPSAFPNDTKSSNDMTGDNHNNGSSSSQPTNGDHSTAPVTPQYAPPSTPYAPPPTPYSAAPAPTSSQYAPPAVPPPSAQVSAALRRPPHTNAVIEAGKVRAKDEQQMQNMLQSLQYQYGIYNSDIEPEHDTDYYCGCPICNYQRVKWSRLGVQSMWSKAVIYPGEKSYNDDYRMSTLFSSNPYRYAVISPYGRFQNGWYQQTPKPSYHAQNVKQTIALNAKLNGEAQRNVDAREPKASIWEIDEVKSNGDTKYAPDDKKRYPVEKKQSFPDDKKSDAKGDYPTEKPSMSKRSSIFGSSSKSSSSNAASVPPPPVKTGKLSGLMKAMKVSTSDDKSGSSKVDKKTMALRDSILAEEDGRWPDEAWRNIVMVYQDKIGMKGKVADLRARQPLQYLHLLRAGYFEPIPVAWANLASNPLKFSIEASSGWRGITPTWRGYEDTAEERLYWVLNHREGSVGMRMKPDPISEMNMARARMAMAVEPPPEYFSPEDTCHLQHTSEGYSKQVMPPPFRPFDRPETPNDDTMILLDVSGSMDFDPLRPIYDQYMITGYVRSTQPKNKDVAKAIIRRFTDAMANHDHTFSGYDLTTFANSAHFIGSITHKNLDSMWRRVKIGGGTRVMTGWQMVKDRHFQKHSASATHHPVYGWQAGPETPMLRLLLLLDGEATDMDEFELDLLGLSWAHVTIFLIGVDGCPHHHRHANELQRISDVNHHVSFVDAQGNTPERFVTHELLKRHLGYDVTMSEFQRMEELPAYTA